MTRVAWDVRRFESLGSTNEWAMAQARAGAPAGLVAVAEHQTAGRGRLGRRWESPPRRSLLVSLLLRPLAPREALFGVSAAVALAAADACRTVAGVAAAVKWPNDLVVGDRKLAGVLAESDASAPGGRPGSVAVVVGVGCNVDWAPEGATSVAAEAAPGTPRGKALRDALLHALLARVGEVAGELDSPGGRRRVIEELRARCATIGQEVRVELDGSTVSGRARDIDGAGRLVVDTGGGPVTVAAGDVVHVRPAS